MADQPDLGNRVALVTGASRGIGAAIALALADAGAAVAINFHEREDAANEVAEQIRTSGGRALPVRADVSKSADVARMISKIGAELAEIDILVNNAGIGWQHTIDDLTEEQWNETIAVNLTSAFLCTQAVYPAMRERGWGRIVNITSGAARGPGGIGVHYNASKAGMEGLTRGYASTLAGNGITVNAVAPSLILTDMFPTSLEEAKRRIPAGRPGTPEEVAMAVIMVLANPYITGQTIQLNGGLSFI
ncbi:MAG: SDR family NAD(P)-dependent oxidoreductase [Rhizobiales bacterium]|nr:SDR family NAD(P)-dependent oxidoreductase [Hyphomicrobiales bacterium]